ncbi:MAG TPA: GldG family protein [Burkholderiales bacterium]|nr:GldG family protein [Burkholderiales bacterium]
MKRLSRRQEAVVYSIVGLAALFLLLVAANFLASAVPVRADLTEGKLHTLSPATRKLLRGLQAPVKVKLYISSGDAMPVPMRSFARRVVTLVDEFRSVAGSNLVVERYDPSPDSEAEDAAQLDGIEPQTLATGEQFYLGLVASRLDRKQVIPVVAPARERLLEYDLIRAVARAANPERPRLGLMSPLPVLGASFNPYTRQQATDPWVLANELRRDFEVKTIDPAAASIPADVNVLLLIHPRDVTGKTEYALDQFVLRGGKLIAFVDPYAYFDQLPTPMPGMPPQVTSSSLPHLFKAWGVGMSPDKVVSDVVYGSGQGPRYTPTVLTLNRTAFSRDDVVTSQLESLLYAFGGAFEVKPADGLSVSPLVRSSPNSMLVESGKATAAGPAATNDFVPSGHSMLLALRLSGKFRTAFPDGPPKDTKPATAPATAPGLKAAARENAVVLVADTDMLQDGAAVDVQEVFGRRVVVPSNGNLAFAQGLVEQLSSDESLLSLKSRASAYRPLTVVREMEAKAQLQYFGKIKELEDELQKTNDSLKKLEGSPAKGAAASAQILTPEQQAEIDRFKKKVAETRLALKELRRNLRHDSEQLVFLTKIANIALMPLLVALAGLGVALVRRRRQARGAGQP